MINTDQKIDHLKVIKSSKFPFKDELVETICDFIMIDENYEILPYLDYVHLDLNAEPDTPEYFRHMGLVTKREPVELFERNVPASTDIGTEINDSLISILSHKDIQVLHYEIDPNKNTGVQITSAAIKESSDVATKCRRGPSNVILIASNLIQYFHSKNSFSKKAIPDIFSFFGINNVLFTGSLDDEMIVLRKGALNEPGLKFVYRGTYGKKVEEELYSAEYKVHVLGEDVFYKGFVSRIKFSI